MRYFPFTHDKYEMTMNARAGVDCLIECDPETYHSDLRLKEEILASDYAYYCQCQPEAEAIAWETIALLLTQMAHCYPAYFTLTTQGSEYTWTNTLLGTMQTFTLGVPETLPLPPLDWLGRQLQEDLILMAANPAGTDTVCVGGHLCFGSAWCLPDKMGQSFGAIHAHVPEFAEQIGRPSHLMMQRLKAGRPTARLNWTVASTDHFNLAPKLRHEWEPTALGITPENAGMRCWLRVERQTFSRLRQTNGILFTIRTYLTPFSAIASHPEQRRLSASVLKGIPAETLAYKGMLPYITSLIAYLDT